MTKRIACLFVLAIALVGLAGCPDTGLLVPILNTVGDDGYAITKTLPMLGAEVEAPDGHVHLTFEGGDGFESANGSMKLRNVTKPVSVNVMPGIPADTKETPGKCISCGVAVAGAGFVVGTAVVATGAMVGVNQDKSFDIVLDLGPAVETFVLTAIGDNGYNSAVTIYGPAFFNSGPTTGYHLSTMVSPAGAGGINVDPNLEEYEAFVKVNLEAVANDGYVFDHWMVNGVESAWTDVNAEVSMDNDLVQVIAVFKQINTKAVLDVSISPVGAGSVSVNPDKAEYNIGDKVQLKANPKSGYTFEGWEVNGTAGVTTMDAEVSMDSDKVEVIAKFKTTTSADTTPPVITLLGANPMYLTLGTTYVEPGATALDAVDGNCLVTITGMVNVNVVGTYVITYTCSDHSGNVVTATRSVVVQDVGSSTHLVIDVTSDANGALHYAVTHGPANGVAGLELYQSSAPNIQRNTTTTNSSGVGSGVLTNFRANLSRTLRCTAVLSDIAHTAYVPNEKVTVKLNGAIMPLVADKDGNWAFQASF